VVVAVVAEEGPPLALVPAREQGEEAVEVGAAGAEEVLPLVRAPEREEAGVVVAVAAGEAK
jgi:hypothetical protein